MKKLILQCLIIFSFYAAQAQVPQALNYQAVARTSQGLIIPNQQVGVRFSILEGSPGGTLLYQETGSTTTNNFGLFTMAVGNGIPVTGTFSGINWANGLLKYLKVEVAPGGGTAYNVQGTSILLSVPFALYAEKTKLLAGNNTITITNGNTITGNYVAGNNTVQITGNAITGNYVPANNTVLINGNTIAGNYVAGNNTVQITGNAITGNYVAGTGINITGNVITSTVSGGSQWINHANGIYYPSTGVAGNVGIRTTPLSNTALTVSGDVPGVAEGNAVKFTSTSTWHTAEVIENVTSNSAFALVIGGTGNTEVKPRNLGLINTTILGGWVYTVDASNNNIGIGETAVSPSLPKSKLHVKTGDIYLEEIGRGVILKSPNGQCWRITVDNSGNLVRTAITCP